MEALSSKIGLNRGHLNDSSCHCKPSFPFHIQPRFLQNDRKKSFSTIRNLRFDGNKDSVRSGRRQSELVENLMTGLRTSLCAAATAALICNSPASAESLTISFPASKAREVNTVQRTLVEAWGVIRETFVDPTFNHQDWDLQLQQTMVEMFPLKTADAAYNKISSMLATLGDPFTRLISPKEYQSFRIGSDGNVQGVGLFISTDPHSGETVTGVNGEEAAQKLRGRVGTSVTIKLLETAATDMENAINTLEKQGIESYILDLRNNPGGLVKAGLDVAQIWLDGNETLVNTVDRDGNMLPINMVNGHALTRDPLVVLVNEGSASASEILAGALHDNGRAILVGHKTFGKGKIQSVTELHDGSALFVTVAKYMSPALHDIDQVGIAPDVQCMPDILSLHRFGCGKARENWNRR